jgi:hypothetical protein
VADEVEAEFACERCGAPIPDRTNRPVCSITSRRCKPVLVAPASPGPAEAPGSSESDRGELEDSVETVAEARTEPGDTPETGDELAANPLVSVEDFTEPADTADSPGDSAGDAAPGSPESDRGDAPGPGDPGSSGPGTEVRRHFDWPSIRAAYVQGVDGPAAGGNTIWLSLTQLAERFGIGITAVKERSSREGWPAQRAQFQAQVEAKRAADRAELLSKKGMTLDDNAIDVGSAGLALVRAKLAEIGQAAQAARSNSGPGKGSGGTINSTELQRLASAADLFHKVGARALGDPEARVVVSGPSGGPIEITQELRKDDHDRVAGVLSVLQQAGLGDLFGSESAAAATLEAERGADGVYTTEPARR